MIAGRDPAGVIGGRRRIALCLRPRECSVIVERLEASEPALAMPPGAPRSETERCAIRTWIANGAHREPPSASLCPCGRRVQWRQDALPGRAPRLEHLLSLSGLTRDGLNLNNLPRAMRGVTCYFCHTVDQVQGTHDARLVPLQKRSHALLFAVNAPSSEPATKNRIQSRPLFRHPLAPRCASNLLFAAVEDSGSCCSRRCPHGPAPPLRIPRPDRSADRSTAGTRHPIARPRMTAGRS